MPEPRGPLMSPGFWLHHAALEWRQRLDRALRPLGLTPTQFSLLGSVGWLDRTRPTPPTQQQVADHAGADRMMASKVLRTLEERGLVTREPDPGDARSLRLRLTADGSRVTSQAVQLALAVDQELFGDGGEQLREQLQAVAAPRLAGLPPPTGPAGRSGLPEERAAGRVGLRAPAQLNPETSKDFRTNEAGHHDSLMASAKVPG